MAEDTQNSNVSNPGGSPIASLLKNKVSLIGVALAGVAFVNIVFLAALDLFPSHSSPYIGILAYMIAPGFLVAGLVVAVAGMIMERRRRAAATGSAKMPRIDLNDPAQRSSVAFALSFVVIFALISAVGSYKAYEFTDSIGFCGQLCHSVMGPEFTTYQASPHARVGCVDCHVGPGAGWYVKSKLSGIRQVYYTAMGTFPRPIPSPVANLRPAQETCEQCHWPRKFWGSQLKVFTHFAPDEQNTPRVLRLLIKTGGGDPSTGQTVGGIHWHMNINNKILYYAADEQRMNIPYIRMESANGEVTEFTVKDKPPTQEQINKAGLRRMDCIDCHDRPSHIFLPPDISVDRGMLSGAIDPRLPYIKQQAVQVLTAEYKTTPDAQKGIAEGVNKFYQEKYPKIASDQAGNIKAAVAELQRIYSTSMFPEMKVDWKTHANNIGHFYFQGCFRCHDGNHVSKTGKVISKDCNACHTVLDQEEGGMHLAQLPSQEFKHPVDLGDMTAVNCSDCHTGGVGP